MKARLLLAALLALVIAAPLLAPAGAAAPGYSLSSVELARDWRSKVAPELLRGDAYTPTLPEISQALDAVRDRLLVVDGPPSELARVTIYFYGGQQALAEIKERVYRVTSALAPGEVGVAYALATPEQVEEVAKLPFVVYVKPQAGITSLLNPAEEVEPAPFAAPLQEGGMEGGFPFYSAPKLLGAEKVWMEYGITGEGVSVAVVDTGIDLGAADLGPDKVARDDDGTPLIFDSDGIGFVYTGNPADRVNSTHVYIPGWFDGFIIGFFPWAGVFIADWSTWVYAFNSFTGLEAYYEVNVTDEFYEVPSYIQGETMFGLAYQVYLLSPTFGAGAPIAGYVILAAPVLVADVDGDGTFDGFYVDLSTTYYLLLKALSNVTLGAIPEAPEELLDMSFADEDLITYGNEVIARDFNGDGFNDFSLGSLAAAYYDIWGLFGDTYYHDWISDWEPGALVVPGFDSQNGEWVDIVYDFHGHGTSVAHVIAASGEVPRPVEGAGFMGNVTMPGIAKGATIGGAPALFEGDVVVAQLWLAGFDMVDPETFTWEYTGDHQADIISNSWGSSWLLYTGYASDADPTGLWQAYIMAVSGTIIVHAAGNGGPGWGTVTMPGATPFIITVGAATDFYYRPFFGIGSAAAYLPGGWGQVISWSDRGPTQFGYPKPDVTNIGSFEWAGTRAVDAPWDGRYTFDLFGGTSEATPMTSGVVALILQALRETGMDYDPFLVKAILKSTADDKGFNPFSQGSGFVNAYKAVKLVMEGGVVAYSYLTPHLILFLFDETFAKLLGITPLQVHGLFFQADAKETAIYPGVMLPGQSKTMEVVVKVLGGGEYNATVYDYTFMEMEEMSLAEALMVDEAYVVYAEDSTLVAEPAGGYIGVSDGQVYLNLTALPGGVRLVVPIAEEMAYADFAVLSLALPMEIYFPLDPYDAYGRPFPGFPLAFLGPELAVWFDLNENGVPDYYNGFWEVARLGYDIREGPVANLEIGNAEEAIMAAAEAAAMILGMSPEDLASKARLVLDLRVFYNLYQDMEGYEMVPLDGGLTVYARSDSMMVETSPASFTVSGEATFNVTITVPEDTPPGIYEAYVVVEAGWQRILIPVSVPVALVADLTQRGYYVITGLSQPYIYDNYRFRGALDQGWRPETGDWRVFPVAVKDPGFTSPTVTVRVYWFNEYSDYDAGLVGPGLNVWGVVDYSFITYVDAAVLGAKLTMPYVVGVYGYYDWPMPGVAAFAAPLDPLRQVYFGEEYTVYWVVVHQKFSDSPSEPFTVSLQFGLYLGGAPMVEVEQGGEAMAAFAYYSPYYMPYSVSHETLYTMVVPIEGQENLPEVMVDVSSLGAGSVRFYNVYANATSADAGSYIAVTGVATDAMSVTVGVTYFGLTELYYAAPMIYNVFIPVIVTPAGGG